MFSLSYDVNLKMKRYQLRACGNDFGRGANPLRHSVIVGKRGTVNERDGYRVFDVRTID